MLSDQYKDGMPGFLRGKVLGKIPVLRIAKLAREIALA